jgi:hypothetical protein
MTRSRRQAEYGLFSGYKKAEKVARKKVVIEVSGVGFLVSGKKDKKTETSLFVIWNLYSYSTLKQLAIFTGKAIEQGKPKLPPLLPGVLGWLIESNSLKL